MTLHSCVSCPENTLMRSGKLLSRGNYAAGTMAAKLWFIRPNDLPDVSAGHVEDGCEVIPARGAATRPHPASQ